MAAAPAVPRRTVLAAVALAAAALLSACAGGSSAAPSAGGSSPVVVRLGYFANVTHASPLIGVEKGLYQSALGGTRLETQIFNAGGTAIEALLSGAVDAAYVGPSPAINGFQKSRGEALRIVAGATSGGASLVVRAGITSPQQLTGKTLATPQTGATQDVAARTWLAQQGFPVDKQGGGAVTIVAQDNPTTLQAFQQERVDGGWLPEPWASRLVLEGGAVELVDEKSLWPQGRFVTTQLVVRSDFLREHPDSVRQLIRAQVDTDSWVAAHPQETVTVADAALEKLTGARLRPDVLRRALATITLTEDPLAESLQANADRALALGLQKSNDLKGIYDLRLLREVLGRDVSDGGLGSPS